MNTELFKKPGFDMAAGKSTTKTLDRTLDGKTGRRFGCPDLHFLLPDRADSCGAKSDIVVHRYKRLDGSEL